MSQRQQLDGNHPAVRRQHQLDVVIAGVGRIAAVDAIIRKFGDIADYRIPVAV